jgi:predicted small secreted protein
MVISVTLISFLLLSGCNTTQGFGKDLEKGGQAIQKAALNKNHANKNNR